MTEESTSRFQRLFGKDLTTLNLIYIIVCLAFCCIMLIYYLSGRITSIFIRPMLLMVMMALAFYPKKTDKNWVKILDIVFVVLTVVTNVYFYFHYEEMMYAFGNLNIEHIIMGVILVLLLCEATRRKMGIAMPLIAILFMLYAYFGHYLSGTYVIHKISLPRIISTVYSTEGIYGTCHGVMMNTVFVFLIFGAFLGVTGGGDFFLAFAKALCGKAAGGPAKIAVMSSMLLGSITGNAVSNVVATGSFTIPMMKKLGYKPEFAGAVEAAASTGGQIMPPVMGATAFLIAEMSGVPFSKLMLISFIPAFFYYASVFLGVHYEAMKNNIKGLSEEDLPKMKPLLKKDGILALPLILIFVMLLTLDFTVEYTALLVVAIMIVIGLFRKQGIDRLGFILQGFIEAVHSSVGTALACGLAGVIVSMVTVTSLSFNFSLSMTSLVSSNTFLALVMVLLIGLILGMGLPTISAFILMASVSAPALITLGLPTVNTYLIMFWFALISNVTPPVCLAAYAAAGIAGSQPFKTGINAFRLALPMIIIPFMMAYRKILLDGTAFEVIISCVCCTIGLFCFSILFTGFFKTKLNIFERLICLVGGFSAFMPELVFDILGVGCVIILFVMQTAKYKKHNANQTPPTLAS